MKQEKIITKIVSLLKGLSLKEAYQILMRTRDAIEEKQKIT